MDLSKLNQKLRKAGVVFESGLTHEEIRLVEASFGFRFPPDLKSYLMFALPSGKGWPNWRDIADPEIHWMLNWPYEGMCFDIQNNVFWPAGWGAKPESLTEAFEVAKRKIEAAPKLIPILGHRYLPDRPSIEGNPVFSVYQTDIIYYGSDLWDYFRNEFPDDVDLDEYQISDVLRRIEFWSDFVDGDLTHGT